jgi:hypothetical protein
MSHDLKTWPEAFAALLAGTKTYEIRKADRPFAVGDTLRLREWIPTGNFRGYTGREVSRVVTYMTPPGEWGLPADLCVMSLAAPTTGGAATASNSIRPDAVTYDRAGAPHHDPACRCITHGGTRCTCPTASPGESAAPCADCGGMAGAIDPVDGWLPCLGCGGTGRAGGNRGP